MGIVSHRFQLSFFWSKRYSHVVADAILLFNLSFGKSSPPALLPAVATSLFTGFIFYVVGLLGTKRHPAHNKANSEHSRHWFFSGKMVIDGNEKEKTLFKLVKETLPKVRPVRQ